MDPEAFVPSYGGITPAPLPEPISAIEGREAGSALNQPFGCGTWAYLCVLGVVACCALVSGSGRVMSITVFCAFFIDIVIKISCTLMATRRCTLQPARFRD